MCLFVCVCVCVCVRTNSCLSRIVDNFLLSFRPRVAFIRAEIRDGSKDMITSYLKEKDNEGDVECYLMIK